MLRQAAVLLTRTCRRAGLRQAKRAYSVSSGAKKIQKGLGNRSSVQNKTVFCNNVNFTQKGVRCLATKSLDAKKAAELNDEAERLIATDRFVEAEIALLGALQKYKPHAEGPEDSFLARLKSNLAFTYLSGQQYEEARKLFEESLPIMKKHMDNSKEYGMALLNYAESLANLKLLPQAEQTTKDAIKVFRTQMRRDELLAGALSNLSGYLCVQKKFEDARPPALEAMEIFRRELGKVNSYTKNAFANYCTILKELKRDQEIKDLEADWDIEADTALNEHFSGAEKSFMEKSFGTVGPRKGAEPVGIVKDPKFYKDEMKSFLEGWQKSGRKADDPAYLDVLEQEAAALKENLDQVQQIKDLPEDDALFDEINNNEELKQMFNDIGKDSGDVQTALKDLEQMFASMKDDDHADENDPEVLKLQEQFKEMMAQEQSIAQEEVEQESKQFEDKLKENWLKLRKKQQN
jgi:tetratricopeptide (TPR) repeat protein